MCVSYEKMQVFRDSNPNLRRHVSPSGKCATARHPIITGSTAFEPLRTGCRALVRFFKGKSPTGYSTVNIVAEHAYASTALQGQDCT